MSKYREKFLCVLFCWDTLSLHSFCIYTIQDSMFPCKIQVRAWIFIMYRGMLFKNAAKLRLELVFHQLFIVRTSGQLGVVHCHDILEFIAWQRRRTLLWSISIIEDKSVEVWEVTVGSRDVITFFEAWRIDTSNDSEIWSVIMMIILNKSRACLVLTLYVWMRLGQSRPHLRYFPAMLWPGSVSFLGWFR